jgi:hypothetical protein
MKKILAILVTILLLVSMLASCAKSGSSAVYEMEAPQAQASAAPYADSNLSYDADEGVAVPSESSTGSLSSTGSVLNGISTTAPLSQKMIYTVSADIETTQFEETLNNVYTLMNSYGGFVENSYISGKNYAESFYGYETYRTANFTIRVPADKLTIVTDNLSTLGNVTSSETQSQNITIQFIDAESRLKACRAEETSLLAMLEKAETIEVMLTIESRLTDVRYEIESLTSTLKNWQNQVDYSTINLHISEVAQLSDPQPPVQRTYWEEVRDGFNDTLKGIGQFFKGLFKGFVKALPVLVILAVIAVIVMVIVKAASKRNQKRYESHRIPNAMTNNPDDPRNKQ